MLVGITLVFQLQISAIACLGMADAAMGAVLLVFAWNFSLALRVWTRLQSVG